MQRSIPFILLLFLSAGCLSQKKPNTMLWKVSKKGNAHISYLFGTFHQVNPDFFDSLKVANQCLKHSKILFVEEYLNSKDSAKNASLIRKSLKQLETWNKAKWDSILTPKQKQTFGRFVNSDLWKDKYYKLTPVIMLFTLQYIYFQRICDTVNRTSNEPMDKRIVDIGLKNHLKIIGLDKNQAALIYHAGKKDKALDINNSVKIDIRFIKYIINKNTHTDFANFLMDYKRFNLNYFLDKKMKTVSTLLNDRNDKWMRTLPEVFAENDCFVAVGVRHLFYATGLIQQLRKAGYTVMPVTL